MADITTVTIAYRGETFDVSADTATWIGENFYQGWGDDDWTTLTARAIGVMIERALVEGACVELGDDEAMLFADCLDKWALRNPEPRALCNWLMRLTGWPGH